MLERVLGRESGGRHRRILIHLLDLSGAMPQAAPDNVMQYWDPLPHVPAWRRLVRFRA